MAYKNKATMLLSLLILSNACFASNQNKVDALHEKMINWKDEDIEKEMKAIMQKNPGLMWGAIKKELDDTNSEEAHWKYQKFFGPLMVDMINKMKPDVFEKNLGLVKLLEEGDIRKLNTNKLLILGQHANQLSRDQQKELRYELYNPKHTDGIVTYARNNPLSSFVEQNPVLVETHYGLKDRQQHHTPINTSPNVLDIHDIREIPHSFAEVKSALGQGFNSPKKMLSPEDKDVLNQFLNAKLKERGITRRQYHQSKAAEAKKQLEQPKQRSEEQREEEQQRIKQMEQYKQSKAAEAAQKAQVQKQTTEEFTI